MSQNSGFLGKFAITTAFREVVCMELVIVYSHLCSVKAYEQHGLDRIEKKMFLFVVHLRCQSADVPFYAAGRWQVFIYNRKLVTLKQVGISRTLRTNKATQILRTCFMQLPPYKFEQLCAAFSIETYGEPRQNSQRLALGPGFSNLVDIMSIQANSLTLYFVI